MPLQLQVVVTVAAVAVGGGGGGGWLGWEWGWWQWRTEPGYDMIKCSGNAWVWGGSWSIRWFGWCKCSLSRSRSIFVPHLSFATFPLSISILLSRLYSISCCKHMLIPPFLAYTTMHLQISMRMLHFSCRSFCLPLFLHWISPFQIEHYQGPSRYC